MRVISLTNATAVSDPATGTEYAAGVDGVFDLPHEFAVELTTRHASQWRGEAEHEALIAAAKLDELRNPHVLPAVVARLRADLDAALARVAALESRAADGGIPDPQPETTDVESEPKPARAAKKTAAKKTADPASPSE